MFLNCILQDGAEIGYGAKAQEVLGQVRGRYVWSTMVKLISSHNNIDINI